MLLYYFIRRRQEIRLSKIITPVLMKQNTPLRKVRDWQVDVVRNGVENVLT